VPNNVPFFPLRVGFHLKYIYCSVAYAIYSNDYSTI
jgi:hypothetical protein